MRHFLINSSKVHFAWTILVAGLLSLSCASAADVVENKPPVKMSSSGICHAPGTAFYNKTKKFEAYRTIEECVNAGGRLPKTSIPTAGPLVKKSNSGICHDRESAFYSRTKNFTPYESMEACLKSGGRRPKN